MQKKHKPIAKVRICTICNKFIDKRGNIITNPEPTTSTNNVTCQSCYLKTIKYE